MLLENKRAAPHLEVRPGLRILQTNETGKPRTVRIEPLPAG